MSQSIAFIGIGNMGCPMAENLMKAGKTVKVFDVSEKMLEIAKDKDLDTVSNLNDLITDDVETVITMLPEGKHSKEVYLGENGIINKVSKNCLLIDCSTIDIQTSIEIGKKASEKRINMIEFQARKILPQLGSIKSTWLGRRPTLPDAKPIIGRSPKNKNVMYAFGHQHIGWTLAAVTGKAINEIAKGSQPNFDISPFSPNRFN